MIDHLSIGTRDLGRAQAFYDEALAPLGYRRLSADASSLGYGAENVSFYVLASEAPVPANAGSGLHVCFAAPTRASVDAFYTAALASGGRDNGKPGVRQDYDPNYYAAFVIDPDGYRLEAYCGSEI